MTMNSSTLIPVVLCGGSGTRLWPLSRDTYPKQFLQLLGKQSLLQRTVQRVSGLPQVTAPMMVTHESSRFIVAEQLREAGIRDAQILLEPMRRNTAPAMATAALCALSRHEDPLMLVLPSDHLIKDTAAFHRAIEVASKAAREGKLVTFGIKPTRAETGYGYICANQPDPDSARPVLEFVEKPDRHTAEQYVSNGNYYWNSGMFLFRARTFIEELELHQPDVLAACRESLQGAAQDIDFVRLDEAAYAKNPDIAVDYAVMERTQNAAMVALDAEWSDIGSWASVWEAADKDERNNATQGDAMLEECENCLVHSSDRLVVAVGLRNVVVVETPDAVLVMDADHAQQAKQVVKRLSDEKRPEATQHRKIFRPWGAYDSIGMGQRFQVKRISVKQGAKLSLQMHHHRAEHWVVVSGTAKITNGDKEYLLTENQSTYIPVGVVHSLENPGKIPLELIEIQSGEYLGEDDIVRLQDRYGRA